MGPWLPGCCSTTAGLGGGGRGGVGEGLGFVRVSAILFGLNSLALGFRVDFLT